MVPPWIKIRKELVTDPAVLAMSKSLDIDEYAVVGRLVKLWSWADSHTEDGYVPSVTGPWIVRFVEHPGFSSAMCEADWLRFQNSGIFIPKYDRHNSQTAKTRALTAIRMGNKRDAAIVTKSSPDKIREDKKNNTPISPFEKTAQTVVEHYQKTVAPKQSKARGVHNVEKLLKEGASEEDLKRAADAYSQDCKSKEPQYRIAVGNFYGRDRVFKDYLASESVKSYAEMTPEQIWDSVKTLAPEDRLMEFKTLTPELLDRVHEARRDEIRRAP